MVRGFQTTERLEIRVLGMEMEELGMGDRIRARFCLLELIYVELETQGLGSFQRMEMGIYIRAGLRVEDFSILY